MRRKEKETELRFEETRRCSQRGEERERENKSREWRGSEERKEGEKERESGKGDDDDGVEFGMIESERSEDYDSVTKVFCHDDVVVLIDCHSRRMFEPSRTFAEISKGLDVISLIIKDLDSLIVFITNDDVVVLIDGHSCWMVKMTRIISL